MLVKGAPRHGWIRLRKVSNSYIWCLPPPWTAQWVQWESSTLIGFPYNNRCATTNSYVLHMTVYRSSHILKLRDYLLEGNMIASFQQRATLKQNEHCHAEFLLRKHVKNVAASWNSLTKNTWISTLKNQFHDCWQPRGVSQYQWLNARKM